MPKAEVEALIPGELESHRRENGPYPLPRKGMLREIYFKERVCMSYAYYRTPLCTDYVGIPPMREKLLLYYDDGDTLIGYDWEGS
jgi:hypothetical protein